MSGESTYGLLYNQGALTRISVPGSADTVANGIDNQGQIVGYYNGQSGPINGFVYADGQFASFDVPGGVGST